MSERIKACQVISEPAIVENALVPFFTIECGQSYVAFESLFRDTRVTGNLFVFVNSTDCTFSVIVKSKDQPDIVRTITPAETNRLINLTIDCLEKVVFSCAGGSGNFCQGNYTLTVHWCKCC